MQARDQFSSCWSLQHGLSHQNAINLRYRDDLTASGMMSATAESRLASAQIMSLLAQRSRSKLALVTSLSKATTSFHYGSETQRECTHKAACKTPTDLAQPLSNRSCRARSERIGYVITSGDSERGEKSTSLNSNNGYSTSNKPACVRPKRCSYLHRMWC